MRCNKTIYALIDPILNHVKYIGITTNPKNRLRQHCDLNHNSNLHNLDKFEYLTVMLEFGHKWEMLILDTIPAVEAKFWEHHYIDLYKSFGFVLLNGTTDGLKTKTTFRKK